ncbi:MAG: hypothetical protein WDA00_03005 [Eubacteriales bacterium]
MKKVLAILLVSVLCLSIVACGGTTKTTTTGEDGTTTPPATTTSTTTTGVPAKTIEDIAAMLASAPAGAISTVVMTTADGDTLTSTFTIDANGDCAYSVQRFREFTPGEGPIETVTGTKTSAEANEAISLATLTLSAAYFSELDVAEDGTSLEGVLSDSAALFGADIDIDGAEILITTDGTHITSVVVTYTKDGSDFSISTEYSY